MIEVKFKNRKINIEKLLSFGFQETGGNYIYYTDFVDGQMKLTVKIDSDGKIDTEVVDNVGGEEYVLHRVDGATGSFVGQVKSEYEAILEKISKQCFDTEIFKGEQAKAVIAYVRNKYGDELEYLWQKFPDNAVVRRKDTMKWYGALLTVAKSKLGFASNEIVEIIDLRIRPENMSELLQNDNYYPGWHMNKKNWYTIILDGSVATQDIFKHIDESYQLAF